MITNNNNNNVFDFYVFQMFLWRKVIITISLSFEISLNKYFENMYADCLFFCNLTTLKKKMHVLGCLPKVWTSHFENVSFCWKPICHAHHLGMDWFGLTLFNRTGLAIKFLLMQCTLRLSKFFFPARKSCLPRKSLWFRPKIF